MTISRPSSRDPALELDPTRFHPIILTPYGEWWRWGNNAEHNDFMSNVAHSDDGAPDYDIEAQLARSQVTHHAALDLKY